MPKVRNLKDVKSTYKSLNLLYICKVFLSIIQLRIFKVHHAYQCMHTTTQTVSKLFKTLKCFLRHVEIISRNPSFMHFCSQLHQFQAICALVMIGALLTSRKEITRNSCQVSHLTTWGKGVCSSSSIKPFPHFYLKYITSYVPTDLQTLRSINDTKRSELKHVCITKMNKSNLDYYATKGEFYYQLMHSLSQHHGVHGGESLPGVQGNRECDQ